MKRNVIINGLISGTIITTFMMITMWTCYSSEGMGSSMVVGFSAMIIAFSMIIVAVKNQRDKLNDGVITFGKAFMVGLYVSLIASSMYVLGWAIEYHYFMPDFMEKYTALQIRKLQAENASPAEFESKMKQFEMGAKMYGNPVSFALITYTEILPVGVLMSLIIALIMRRKEKKTV